MKLRNVDPTEFSEMYNNSFEPKQKVNKEAVQNIIGEFVYSGIFIMEVVLSEEDRPNSRAIITAMRDFISIYAKIKGSSGSYTMELLDDTTVDLSGKVDKVAGKGLSTNDYTTAEKNKLAGIAEGANNYVHPSYTAKASGLYKVTVDATGHVSAVAAVTKDDITALGIPGSDTKYGNATTTNAGLMSAADKAKLDSLVLATEVEVAAMLDEVFAGE